MTISLGSLLAEEGIDPRTVIVMRHQPYEPRLRALFPSIALEARDLYNAYQSAHNSRAESALSKASYLASFIADGAGRALFIGMYRVNGSVSVDRERWLDMPENQRLMGLGMLSWIEKDRTEALWFDLELMDFYQHWFGRLVVDWPPPERSWYRWADRNHFAVKAVHEENVLESPSVSWEQIALSWDELSLLPRKLRQSLTHWRGVYLITDRSDGRQYVGSACGAENLLGRWESYSKSGHGGNKLLKTRDRKNFVFSILQRVSPDMSSEEVIAIENSWKLRLRTRSPEGLNEN